MLERIVALAHRAGEAILKVYETDFDVARKSDDSPVTQADLAAHHLIAEGLREFDPDTPLISEEGDLPPYEARRNWARFWLVDPLDGTKEFVKRNGEFTVNIALIEGGRPVLGVVHAPVKALTYYASSQGGAWKREGDGPPQRLASRRADPGRPLVVVSSRSHGSEKLAAFLAQYEVKEHLHAGSSLKFCLVAEGRADVYPRFGPTMEWDVAAGDCVYRHAAERGEHPSPLRYNKPDLRNDGFVIGL